MRYQRYSAHLRMGPIEQQTSEGTLRANRIKKSLDYTNKLENPLYVSQRHEPRQTAGEEYVGPSMNHNDKDDGLIKHMRNLPGYLQGMEKGENVQGKALNFGVLDWGRLENWKSNEKRVPPRYNNIKTSSVSRNRKKIHPPRRDQQSSNGSQTPGERLPPGVRWPRGKTVKVQTSETSPQRMMELGSSKGKQAADQTTAEKETQGSCPSPSDDYINHDDDDLIEANCFSDVPHSCPFPLPRNAELESPNEIPLTPLRQHLTSKKCDVDIDALKGRQQSSSPNRRFSFSLGKMARSFSFKETATSSVPLLSPSYISVKSGPVNLEASPDLMNRKMGNATINPSRSSPLRRFLDPLLKLKGAHVADKIHKSKLDLNPTNVTPVNLNENELLANKKQRSSNNVQALLQLTLKNGVPFFKLVVESNSDILAAAVKKLPSGKDDSSLIYAFYSVHETKKKSGGWIYHGSKERNYHFGYNIVGQMKISSSYHAEFSGVEKDLYVVRESVLYSSDCMLDGELAAIIVKNSSDETCGDIGSSKSTVVVIPDGVHSWPNRAQPSPLINRWRSGACECGGWDIGCQFHILSHHHNDVIKAPTAPSNRLDLCYQVGQKNKCSFRLVSLEDGLYSVEYDPSMSLLQAFSICVAVVSSQKLTHIFQVNYIPESKELSQRIPAVKCREEYVSKPPASPVGRV